MQITSKLLIINIGSVAAAATMLIAAGLWQTKVFNDKSTVEVKKLIDADMNHSVSGVYSTISAQGESIDQQVQHDLAVTHEILHNSGAVSIGAQKVSWNATNQFTKASTTIQLPQLLIGNRWVGKNADKNVETPIVDHAKALLDCKATIFQRMDKQGDMLRVATNIMTKADTRAIGTYIPAIPPSGKPSPIISAVLSGKSYLGPAFIVNAWYISNYEPIFDKKGEVIGMLFAAVPQNSISSLNKAVESCSIGKSGGITILGGPKNDVGQVIISKQDAGANLLNATDTNGNRYIEEIINSATALAPGEIISRRCLTREANETEASWKIYRVSYYAPWSWVIVASAPEKEFSTFETVLNEGRNKMTSVFCIEGAIIVVICGWIVWLLAKTCVDPLREVSKAMNQLKSDDFQSLSKAIKQLEHGDLTVGASVTTQPIKIRYNDEIGEMANNFNEMLSSLNAAITSFNAAREGLSLLLSKTMEATDDIANLATELHEGHSTLSERASSHASSVNETAHSMDAITHTVRNNTQYSKTARELAYDAKSVAQNGGTVVGDAVKSMNDINVASRKINEIVAVIDEISFQTNLLALNASVEAARVGEQGKGFAVVAAEVRNLASRSTAAAKEIKALVRDTASKVSDGSVLVNKSGEQLKVIVTAVDKVAEIIAQISDASTEQALEIEQIGNSITSMDGISKQNSKLVEASSTSSKSILDQASNLQALVGEFKVEAKFSHNREQREVKTGGKKVANGRNSRAERKPTPPLHLVNNDSFEEF